SSPGRTATSACARIAWKPCCCSATSGSERQGDVHPPAPAPAKRHHDLRRCHFREDRSVTRVLVQVGVRLKRPVRDREDEPMHSIRRVIEPRLRLEDTEADQLLTAMALCRELPAE